MRGVLLFLGATAWVLALWFGFGSQPSIDLCSGATDVAAAGVTGFALAGGLCFIAVARIALPLPPPSPSRGRTDLAAVLDQLRFNGVLTDAEYRAKLDKLGTTGSEPPG